MATILDTSSRCQLRSNGVQSAVDQLSQSPFSQLSAVQLIYRTPRLYKLIRIKIRGTGFVNSHDQID